MNQVILVGGPQKKHNILIMSICPGITFVNLRMAPIPLRLLADFCLTPYRLLSNSLPIPLRLLSDTLPTPCRLHANSRLTLTWRIGLKPFFSLVTNYFILSEHSIRLKLFFLTAISYPVIAASLCKAGLRPCHTARYFLD